MKRFLVILTLLILSSAVVFAHGSSEEKTRSGRIGVSLPSNDNQKDKQEGEYLKSALEDQGYKVDLMYASGDASTQNSQIMKMVGKDCKAIIVCPIDSASLQESMKSAQEKSIPVISYKTTVMDSDAVSYHVTYDFFSAGKQVAQSLVNSLGLSNSKSCRNIEFFFENPENLDNKVFLDGLNSALSKYFNAKTLQTKTRQADYRDLSVSSMEEASEKLGVMIQAFYSDGDKIDALVCSDDSLIPVLRKTLDNSYKEKMPLFFGMGCEIDSVKDIQASKQVVSVFFNPKTLAQKTVETVNAIVDGSNVSVSKTVSYNNNVKDVPSCLAEVVLVDSTNIKKELVESGYYKASQLN